MDWVALCVNNAEAAIFHNQAGFPNCAPQAVPHMAHKKRSLWGGYCFGPKIAQTWKGTSRLGTRTPVNRGSESRFGRGMCQFKRWLELTHSAPPS